MADLRRTLEREMERIPPAVYPLEAVERTRRRRRRSQRIRTIGVAFAIAALGIGLFARALPLGGERPAARPSSRIAFISPGGGGAEDRLYTAEPDGGRIEQLADIHAEYPAWSPDGRAIAFDDGWNLVGSTLRMPNGYLYLVDADGGHLRRLAVPGGASAPSWSPDGRRLAVATSRPGGAAGISWIDLRTGAVRIVTTAPYAGSWDAEPEVSPDGTRIAFVRVRALEDRGGVRNLAALMVVNADGSQLRRLTPWTTDAGTPTWSPDGQRIAFNDHDHFGGDGVPQILVIEADGSHLTQLTDARSSSFWPSWAPDGSSIVFSRVGVRSFGLLEIPARGGRAVAAGTFPREANQADWGWIP